MSEAPLLRVVRGEPSAEELAALTVVVAALARPRPRRRPAPVGAWGWAGHAHRRALHAGPGGWRASGWGA
ncbi:acyl-CoA carboxylase subunit epsilon [Geodermatophilus sp. SYSU D00758]